MESPDVDQRYDAERGDSREKETQQVQERTDHT